MAVKERMPEIDEVDNGKILIHGNHSINNINRQGTFLVLFNDSIQIDNTNFTNDENLMMHYVQINIPAHYEILEILESGNEELKLSELTVMEKIPIEIESHPVRSMLFLLMIILITIILLHYSLK